LAVIIQHSMRVLAKRVIQRTVGIAAAILTMSVGLVLTTAFLASADLQWSAWQSIEHTKIFYQWAAGDPKSGEGTLVRMRFRNDYAHAVSVDMVIVTDAGKGAQPTTLKPGENRSSGYFYGGRIVSSVHFNGPIRGVDPITKKVFVIPDRDADRREKAAPLPHPSSTPSQTQPHASKSSGSKPGVHNGLVYGCETQEMLLDRCEAAWQGCLKARPETCTLFRNDPPKLAECKASVHDYCGAVSRRCLSRPGNVCPEGETCYKGVCAK
jgi:hypothetical protein